MPLRKLQKAKNWFYLKGIGPTYMDKTGRNGIRVGDIELEDFKERYRALADKHEAMICFMSKHSIQLRRT
jgi:adenylosuccinate synthase